MKILRDIFICIILSSLVVWLFLAGRSYFYIQTIRLALDKDKFEHQKVVDMQLSDYDICFAKVGDMSFPIMYDKKTAKPSYQFVIDISTGKRAWQQIPFVKTVNSTER